MIYTIINSSKYTIINLGDYIVGSFLVDFFIAVIIRIHDSPPGTSRKICPMISVIRFRGDNGVPMAIRIWWFNSENGDLYNSGVERNINWIELDMMNVTLW